MKPPGLRVFLPIAATMAGGCAVAFAAPLADSTRVTSFFMAIELRSFALDAATVAAVLLLTVPFGLSILPLLRHRVHSSQHCIKKSGN